MDPAAGDTKLVGSGFSYKGTVLRALLAAAATRGLQGQRLRDALPPRSQAWVDHPPLVSQWVDGLAVVDLAVAVEKLEGVRAWRELSREAVTVGMVPVMRSVLEGILRLFGTQPGALLQRIGYFPELTGRGAEVSWVELTKRSGELHVRYACTTALPKVLFQGLAGSADALLVLTRASGTVSEPQWRSETGANAAYVRVSW